MSNNANNLRPTLTTPQRDNISIPHTTHTTHAMEVGGYKTNKEKTTLYYSMI